MDPKMVKQLQQMQNKMVKAQEDLANETVTATAGGGAVTIEMNGHHEVKAVTLDKDAVSPDDVEMLQDMLLAAFNEALNKAQNLAQEKMGAITGGLNLPGMF
ncbi:MAG TPA: YbaB/EbfC family nucleoid-associated protein [Chloroflexia bacterium]|nr:YbaB/EbfC family nucleoid-associated protein [Chloroflexia bacterium]